MTFFSALAASNTHGTSAFWSLTEEEAAAAPEVVDEVDQEINGDETQQDETLVTELTSLALHISSEGLNAHVLRFADPYGNLHRYINKFPSTVSVEALGDAAKADSDMAAVAVEGLWDTIKEKMGAFFSTIGEWAKKIGSGAVNMVKSIVNKFTGLFKKAEDTADDAAGGTAGAAEDAGGEKSSSGISAKWVIAGLAGLGAAVAILMKVFKIPLPTSLAKLNPFKKEVAETIKASTAKVETFGVRQAYLRKTLGATGTSAADAGKAVAAAGGEAVEKGFMSWTKSAFGSIRKGIAAAGTTIINALKSAGAWLASIPGRLKGLVTKAPTSAAAPLTGDAASKAAGVRAAGLSGSLPQTVAAAGAARKGIGEVIRGWWSTMYGYIKSFGNMLRNAYRRARIAVKRGVRLRGVKVKGNQPATAAA